MSEELAVSAPARLQLASEPPVMFNGDVHVGVAIGLSSGGTASALVVPDFTAVGNGVAPAPVYLAKPLKLDLNNILVYLDSKSDSKGEKISASLEKNKTLNSFLQNTSVSIDAMYYRGKKIEPKKKATDPDKPLDNGILLMQFGLNFTKDTTKGGLIGDLTGDPNLSKLFEITGISLRVLRCDKDNVELLQNYVDGLFAE